MIYSIWEGKQWQQRIMIVGELTIETKKDTKLEYCIGIGNLNASNI